MDDSVTRRQLQFKNRLDNNNNQYIQPIAIASWLWDISCVLSEKQSHKINNSSFVIDRDPKKSGHCATEETDYFYSSSDVTRSMAKVS